LPPRRPALPEFQGAYDIHIRIPGTTFIEETIMWNPIRRIAGRTTIAEGFRRAKYFEVKRPNRRASIFMRWPDGGVWLRVPSHDIGPASALPVRWKPVDRVPFGRREMSREEAHANDNTTISPDRTIAGP